MKDWYEVDINPSNRTSGYYNTMINWLVDNVGSRKYHLGTTYPLVFFDEEADAVAFKLRFG